MSTFTRAAICWASACSHGVGRAKQHGRIREAALVAVADDAAALSCLIGGRPSYRFAGPRGLETGNRDLHIEPRHGLGLAPFECATRRRLARFGEPCTVGKTMEQVDPDDGASHPARGPRIPRAAVQFPHALCGHLRQERGLRRIHRCSRQLFLLPGERDFGPVRQCFLFEAGGIGDVDGDCRWREVEREHRVQGLAHQLIQPGARDAFVRRCLHLPFEGACQLDVQLQDIRVGHATGVAAVARQFAVCPGGLDRGRFRTNSRGGDEDAAKRVSHRRRQVMVDESPAGGRHVPPDRRGADIRRRGAIEQRLLDGDCRAEVVRGIGVIDRIKGEVGRGELPLRKQRTEHEHRVVAALPGFRDVHPREVAAASLRDAVGRFPLGCCCRPGVGVVGPGARDGLRKRKRRLRRGRQRHTQRGNDDGNEDVSLALEGLEDVAGAHGPILRDLSPADHARAVEVLDRQSGEAGMLCRGAT